MPLRWKQGFMNRRAKWAKNPSTGGLYFIISTRRGYMLKVEGDIIGTYSREGEAQLVAEKLADQATRMAELAKEKRPANG